MKNYWIRNFFQIFLLISRPLGIVFCCIVLHQVISTCYFFQMSSRISVSLLLLAVVATMFFTANVVDATPRSQGNMVSMIRWKKNKYLNNKYFKTNSDALRQLSSSVRPTCLIPFLQLKTGAHYFRTFRIQ